MVRKHFGESKIVCKVLKFVMTILQLAFEVEVHFYEIYMVIYSEGIIFSYSKLCQMKNLPPGH